MQAAIRNTGTYLTVEIDRRVMIKLLSDGCLILDDLINRLEITDAVEFANLILRLAADKEVSAS